MLHAIDPPDAGAGDPEYAIEQAGANVVFREYMDFVSYSVFQLSTCV